MLLTRRSQPKRPCGATGCPAKPLLPGRVGAAAADCNAHVADAAAADRYRGMSLAFATRRLLIVFVQPAPGSAVELLLDFSGTSTTLVDVGPNSLASGSPYTCLLTNGAVLLVDEGKLGEVVLSVRLSLGPDVFSRLEVCRCSRGGSLVHFQGFR